MKAFLGLMVVLAWVLGIIGWIANIVVLYGMSFDHLSGALVLRVIGIFIAPLGAILGLFF
jgi:hypothetical protein